MLVPARATPLKTLCDVVPRREPDAGCDVLKPVVVSVWMLYGEFRRRGAPGASPGLPGKEYVWTCLNLGAAVG